MVKIMTVSSHISAVVSVFCSWLTDSRLQFLTLICRHDSVYCDSFSHSSAMVF